MREEVNEVLLFFVFCFNWIFMFVFFFYYLSKNIFFLELKTIAVIQNWDKEEKNRMIKTKAKFNGFFFFKTRIQ